MPVSVLPISKRENPAVCAASSDTFKIKLPKPLPCELGMHEDCPYLCRVGCWIQKFRLFDLYLVITRRRASYACSNRRSLRAAHLR